MGICSQIDEMGLRKHAGSQAGSQEVLALLSDRDAEPT